MGELGLRTPVKVGIVRAFCVNVGAGCKVVLG